MKIKTFFISILAVTCLGISACTKDAPKSSEEPVASSFIEEQPSSSDEPIESSEDPVASSEEPISSEEPPHEHAFGEWTQVLAPTCTEKGKEERVCTCNEKEERDVDALGHLAGDWEVVLEPTVDAEGQKVKKCTRCQEVLETEAIDKLTPPTPVVDPIALTAADLLGYAGTNMSYGDGEGTVGNIKFGFIECGAYGNGIQMRTKNGKSSTIWNKDALPGALKQIKITLNADKQVYANEHALTFYFGATADFTTCYTWDTSVTWDTVADQKSYTINVPYPEVIYFKLVHSITYSLYVDSIELIF